MSTTVRALARAVGVAQARVLRHCDGLGIEASDANVELTQSECDAVHERIERWEAPRSKAWYWDLDQLSELAALLALSNRSHVRRDLLDLLETTPAGLAKLYERLREFGEVEIVDESPRLTERARRHFEYPTPRRLPPPDVHLLEASPRFWNICRQAWSGGGLGPRDLSHWDLVGADLTSLDLSRVKLVGADLGRSSLQGCNLSHRDLRGVNLRGADLTDVELKGVDLRGVTANQFTTWPHGFDPQARGVDETSLDGDNAPPRFHDAVHVDPSTPGHELSGRDLTRADLSGWNLEGVVLDGTKLTGANLQEANLRFARITGWIGQWMDISQACLDDADLSGAGFSRARALGVSMQNANLEGVNFSSCDFRYANLSGLQAQRAMPQHCDFTSATLAGASFEGAHLNGGCFLRADLRNADLRFAQLRQMAYFADADLRGAQLPDLGGRWSEAFKDARLH